MARDEQLLCFASLVAIAIFQHEPSIDGIVVYVPFVPMTSVKRVSDLEASTESPLKKPRDSLDTVEPSVDLEGP